MLYFKANLNLMNIMSKKNLSDEDRALFREVVRTVKPLAKTVKVSSEHLTKPNPPLVRKRETIEYPVRQYDLSNHYPEVVQASSILSFSQQGIPRKRLLELKNGQIHWQATLDLHGLRPDSARDTLCEFINQHSQQAKRCLLIIHGKGGKFGDEPILKNHVNHWLQQLPQVLAFHSALPRDGGSGALYVLLKRQRD